MVKLTHGAGVTYVVQSHRRFKKDQDYYASRSGPVVTVQEATGPRHAFGELREKVLERDQYQCRYCGDSVSNETANIDHVVPFKHGGKTRMDNLVACCQFCNKAKANQVTIKAPGIGHVSDPFGRRLEAH